MATILDFPAAPTRASAGTGSLPRCAAEIVLFPGVRYEHWEAAPAPAPKPKKRPSARRDLLELED